MKSPAVVVQFSNGDFESGSTGWTECARQGYRLIRSLPTMPETHGGNWAAWLGGADDEIPLYDLCSNQNTGGWVRRSVDLKA